MTKTETKWYLSKWFLLSGLIGLGWGACTGAHNAALWVASGWMFLIGIFLGIFERAD